MDDAVTRYRSASAAKDVDGMLDTFAPDAELVSGDAVVLELGEDGLIRRIRPHMRPWLGLTVFALVVGPQLARHPGVIWRALRPR